MHNQAMTKIEILLVISICSLIIIFDIFYISYLDNKSRDIQILSEVKQIQSGLDLFFLSNNYYPESKEALELNDDYVGTEKLCLEGFKRATDKCSRVILETVPNFFLNKDNKYIYKSAGDKLNYQLEFVLKTNNKKLGLVKGKNCATNTQILSQPCF
jgi:competence protein ComGC